MDYKQEIKTLKEELKEFNTGHLSRVAGENTDKTQTEKRKICLLSMYEEINRIDDLSGKENPQEEENYREPLSLDKEEVITILLSWGGGSDGFKLTFKDKELIRGVYFMGDWGEYEEIGLNDDELNKVFNHYLGGEYPEQ